MPKQDYPKWIFRATEVTGADGKPIVESREVRTIEVHEALTAVQRGWAESPEEARGESRAHEDDGGAYHDLPLAVRLKTHKHASTGYVKVEYPKYLFHATKDEKTGVEGMLSTEVKSAEAHAALGDGWFESPDEAKAGKANDAGDETAETATPTETVTPTQTPAPVVSADDHLEEAAEIVTMSAADVKAFVASITDPVLLQAVWITEDKGAARVTVKQAIEARQAELAKS